MWFPHRGRRRSAAAYIFGVAVLTCAVLLSGCGRGGRPAGEPGASPGQGGSPPAAREDSAVSEGLRPCPLCGVPVPEKCIHRRSLAFMIDNAPQAQPQAGLYDACLVYEALAEGGITRFLAFFLHADPTRIGPVRSTRPYFLDLVLPLDAVLGHAGGSEDAYADLKSLKLPHLDEIQGGGEAYWRAEGRKAPHATYTSGERFRAVMERRELEKGDIPPAPFAFASQREPAGGKEASVVTVWYPGGWEGYHVSYAYETATEKWLRSINDRPQKDEEGRQLWASNVVVQFVPMRQIPGDKLLHMRADMTGRGKALLFSEGKYMEVVWSKSSRKAPILYRDEKDRPVEFRAGPTWVLIVPTGSKVEIR